MSTLGKIVYLSEAQASELFANGSITVDGTTITYSANDLYLTPENIDYVKKSGDTISGTLATPRLNIVSSSIPVLWYMSDDTTDAGQVGLRLSDKRYFIGYRNNANKNIYFSLPPLSSDNTSESTWYDILTTKGDYAMTGTLTVPAINIYASSYPGIGFQESANSTNEGRIYFDRPTNRFVLAQFADNSEFSEAYVLPIPAAQSATKWYEILTSKSPVTVAQGGTGATTQAGAMAVMGAYCDSENKSTFTFENLSLLNNSGKFKYGLLYGGEGQDKCFLYFIFLTVDNRVWLYPIYQGSQAKTFTASVSGTTLTLTGSATIYGGVRLIWINY